MIPPNCFWRYFNTETSLSFIFYLPTKNVIVSFYSIAWFGNHTSELHKPPLKGGVGRNQREEAKAHSCRHLLYSTTSCNRGCTVLLFSVFRPVYNGLSQDVCVPVCVCVCVCVCVILNRDHTHTPVTSENGGGQMITDIFLWPPWKLSISQALL